MSEILWKVGSEYEKNNFGSTTLVFYGCGWPLGSERSWGSCSLSEVDSSDEKHEEEWVGSGMKVATVCSRILWLEMAISCVFPFPPTSLQLQKQGAPSHLCTSDFNPLHIQTASQVVRMWSGLPAPSCSKNPPLAWIASIITIRFMWTRWSYDGQFSLCN